MDDAELPEPTMLGEEVWESANWDEEDNFWSTTTQADTVALDVHNSENPLYQEPLWANKDLTKKQWETLLPEILKMADECTDPASWTNRGFQTLQELKDALEITFTDEELDGFSEPVNWPRSKHWDALRWAIEQKLGPNGNHRRAKLETILGAAMTCLIKRDETIVDPKHATRGTGKGGIRSWLEVGKTRMDTVQVEYVLLRVAQGHQKVDLTINAEMTLPGIDGPDTEEIARMRHILPVDHRVGQQVGAWKAKALAHLEELDLPEDMLIGPDDFAVPQLSSRGWVLSTEQPTRFSNPHNVQASLGETILSASLGKRVYQTHRWRNDEGDLVGRHRLDAAVPEDLKCVGCLMFTLGQYSKEQYQWTKVGPNYLTTTLQVMSGHVVGGLPMLELGQDVSGFISQELPITRPHFGMPIGKEWILKSGVQLLDLQYPVTRLEYSMIRAFSVLPRHMRGQFVRDLYDLDGDAWTV